MSEKFKYTSDGKKVAVLGKLNSAQYIVQEIFIFDGQEVPSGENFVVNSLHDAPAESWKEKRIREIEERAAKVERDCKDQITRARQRMQESIEKAKHRADALFAFAKNSDNEQLKLLHAWLAGEVTHVFINGTRPAILPFDDRELFQTDSFHGLKYEAMKLVSLFGETNGQLSFRLHRYSDGSGGYTEIFPARSYDDALAIAQQHLDDAAHAYVEGVRRHFDPSPWEAIDGLRVPEDAAALHRQKAEAAKQSRIQKLREEIAALESAPPE